MNSEIKQLFSEIKEHFNKLNNSIDKIESDMTAIKTSVGIIRLPDSYRNNKPYELKTFFSWSAFKNRSSRADVVSTIGTDLVGQEETTQGTTPLTEEQEVINK